MRIPTLTDLLAEHVDKSLGELERIPVVSGKADTLRDVAEQSILDWESLTREQRSERIQWCAELVSHPAHRMPRLGDTLGLHTGKPLAELEQYKVFFGDGVRTLRDVAERDIPNWNDLDTAQRKAAIDEADGQADAKAKAHDDERQRRLKAEPQHSDEYRIGWYNSTMNADEWFDPEQVVSPEQAAMLMAGWNP